jgi:hypothetical protein
MSHKVKISFTLGLILLLLASVVQAQAPQPTPTNTPRPTPTNLPPPTSPPSTGGIHGSIRGVVYADVNGDGQCVNTGVAGETAVPNIPIEFVSSDEKTVITHTSGADGVFELAGAGESYWRVTAKPPAGWVVTSENPRYAPIYPETPLATGVNFCVRMATAVLPSIPPATSSVLLPDSGAPAASPTATASLWLAFLGLGLILTGLILHRRQRAVG